MRKERADLCCIENLSLASTPIKRAFTDKIRKSPLDRRNLHPMFFFAGAFSAERRKSYPSPSHP